MLQGTKVKVHVYFLSLILEMGLLFPHKLVLSLQEMAPHAQIKQSQNKSPKG